MEIRLWGTNPLKENQIESNEKIDRARRYKQIMECLDGKELTFREIAEEMYRRGFTPTNELLYSQPRVSELVRKGRIEPIGKKKCIETNKMVSVFKVIE